MTRVNATNWTGTEKFVVDPDPSKGNFTTVQSAIDAAALAGNATVWINPGNYVENLVFTQGNISLRANCDFKAFRCSLVGNHTFTNHTGSFEFQDLNLSTPTGDCLAFTSNSAASANVQFTNCTVSTSAAGSALLATLTAPATFQVNFQNSYLDGSTAGVVFDGPVQTMMNYGGVNTQTGACFDLDNGSQAQPFQCTINSGTGVGVTIRHAASQFIMLHGSGSFGAEFIQFLAAGTVITAFMGFGTGAATYWATGTGTLIYGGIGFGTSQTVDPAITQIALGLRPFATSGLTGTALRGTCAFDGTSFSVDSSGFVTFTGATGAITHTAITANQTLAVNNGYYVTSGALSLALPATSAVGDIIEVTLAPTGTSFSITQGAGQQITVGATSSTLSTGSVDSSATGDSLHIECVVADTLWQVVGAVTGALTIT